MITSLGSNLFNLPDFEVCLSFYSLTMERSNEELAWSIVASELLLDAVKSVIEKGQLSPSDEEHVMLCLHPTSIGTNEVELMFSSSKVADTLGVVRKVPEKREVPNLKSLCEVELNETFSLIDKLDNAAGVPNRVNQLTERDILTKVTQTQETCASLIADYEKLYKRSQMTSKYVMEFLDPVVNSLSALELKARDELSEASEKESSALNEIFKDLPEDVLKRLVDDLEEELKARTTEQEAEGQSESNNVDTAAAFQKLKDLDQEIEIKKALLATFFPEEI